MANGAARADRACFAHRHGVVSRETVRSFQVAFSTVGVLLVLCAQGCSTEAATGRSRVLKDAAGTTELDAGVDAGCTPLSSVPSADALPYVTVQPMPNACSPPQIAAFLAACLGTDPRGCEGWLQTSSNARCVGCLEPRTRNSGGLLFGPSGTQAIGTNLPGCIALSDQRNGLACARSLAPALECDAFACGSRCNGQVEYSVCAKAANAPGAACGSYAHSVELSCATAFGDAGAGALHCTSDANVLNVICGSGQ